MLTKKLMVLTCGKANLHTKLMNTELEYWHKLLFKIFPHCKTKNLVLNINNFSFIPHVFQKVNHNQEHHCIINVVIAPVK